MSAIGFRSGDIVNRFAMKGCSMRGRTIAAAGFAALILMAANPALAGYGAFAHDETTGKYGFSWNEANQKQADDAAVKSCNTTGCKVVFPPAPNLDGAIPLPDAAKIL